MERSSDDQAVEQSLAMAEPIPSMSGAHGPSADPFGPDPARVGPNLTRFSPTTTYAEPATGRDPNPDEAAESAAVRRSRHWTNIGTATRRPRTSDRPEAMAPVVVAGPGVGASESPPKPAGSGSLPFIEQLTAARSWGRKPAPVHDDTSGVSTRPGHEIRPHRVTRGPAPAGDNTNPGTATAGTRFRPVFWATLTMVAVVLIGGAAAVAVRTGRAATVVSVLGIGGGSADRRTVTAPLDGRTEASFELATGASQVTLRSEDLGTDLYRITTAQNSGSVPRALVEPYRVQLHLTPDGDGATGDVEIVLTAKVRWRLRFTGGADEQRIDLSRGSVSGIDVVGGARRIDLTLPTPVGTVNVRITGAVNEFTVTAPRRTPVRLTTDGGAKTVAAGNRTQRDVPPGSTFTPRNWQATDRYDIAAAARVTRFSVVAAG